jgi:FkbM family methyltransferase
MGRSALVTAGPVKVWAARALTSPAAGRVIGTLTRHRVRHYGLRFDVSSPDFSPRVRAQMFWGIYEGAEVRMIRRHLAGSTAVLELGSSLGVTAAHLASVMAPGGRLVCVEANPFLADGLRDRLRQNVGDRVRVERLHVAVTAAGGTATLDVGGETFGSRVSGVDGAGTVTVPAMTLRQIVEQTGLVEYDLVSDVEGAEAAFLLTDASALAGCRRAVLELHSAVVDGRTVTPYDLMDAAEAVGLRVVDQHGPVVALARD